MISGTPAANASPSILKRRRHPSSPQSAADAGQRPAKRIKFAAKDSVGACVDPVFSDEEEEETKNGEKMIMNKEQLEFVAC